MIAATPERRSQGALITFVDLLFLLIAFFVLLLFFIQQQRAVVEIELEEKQAQLESMEQEKSAIEAVIEEVQPYIAQFNSLRRVEKERKRAEAARDLRRQRKGRVKLEYVVLENGEILHQEQRYSVERFIRDVVAPMRETEWISFRAFARPETPFGRVVGSRRKLLVDQGEFDTYWDNLTRQNSGESR